MEKDDSKANRLIHETSPYLLQHAYNPVDWFPWCEEAFEKAKAEDKPILLSCGYSSCHWCHVMEKESFENIEIASLMNQNFISVKVDREERPDIDKLYQHAIQMIAGGGGWPLTVFLDHERKPFYGGTYFPPVPMYGQSGFPHILRTIAGKWHNKRMDITKDSAEIFRSLQSIVEKPSFSSLSEQDLPEIAAHELFTEIDEKNGGFGSEPKFPNPVLLQLLLSNGTTDNQTSFLEHVKFTLEQMSRGGIYDQLGGGFHRYSTDRYWLVPHFEKMLCDNAQLIKLYTVGYQLTKADMFKRVVTETSDYIRREMTDPQGGFYSTQDADSEGVEGKYYIWDIQEIRSALDPDETQLFIDYYGISEEGNFEGCNILNRIQQSDKVIEPGLISKLTNAKQRLLSIRNDRVKPFRDEKIITSWNGLMIGALACSYQVFNREEDYQSACRAAEFVLKSVRLSNGNLARTYKDGQAKIEGMLDDYSFLVRGLIDLYETDMNEVWLQKSLHFTEAANKQFAAGIGHYYMSKYTEELAVKPLSGQDEATPSGVAVHCENLLRLAAFTGNLDFYREAEKILMAYSLQIEEDNWGHAGLIDCLNMYYKGFSQFVFISTEEEIPEMLLNLRKNYIPYRILAWGNNISKNSTTHPAGGLFQKREAIQGKPTCYACFQKSCFPAVSSWEELKNIVYKKGLSLL